MSREDLIQVDGKVVNLSGGGVYQVTLANGITVDAKLCGKMKKFKIRIVVGDNVTVGFSPYDTSHGLIQKRLKA